jgi:NADH dehydrogenase
MVRVVVAGGGFGGVYAIRALQRRMRGVRITLIEPQERFVFTPLLHEVAVDVLHTPSVTHPYPQIFRAPIRHVRSRAVRIDPGRKIVLCADGTEVPFDYCVLAPGSRTRIPAGVEDVLEIKDVAHALALKDRVERNVHQAALALASGDRVGAQVLLSCAVVGGGPTGVEIAGELVDFYRDRARAERLQGFTPSVDLLHGGERILPTADDFVQRTAHRRLMHKGVSVRCGMRVQRVSGDAMKISHNKKEETLRAGCIVWAAGIVPNEIEGIALNGGYIEVANTLQVAMHPSVFGIGDAARVVDGPLPALAQVAVQQGAHVGAQIARLAKGERARPFRYRSKGFLVSLGQRYGAGRVVGVPLKGFFAWFLWRTIYLAKFVGVRSKVRMAAEYTKRLFRCRDV